MILRAATALLPGDMVALIEGGERSLDAARRALQWAADEGPDAAGFPIVHPAEGLHFLPPVPRPPLLRDFMGFETHLLNIFPRLEREIPPECDKIPVYTRGIPGASGRTATTFRSRRTPRRSISSSSWPW